MPEALQLLVHKAFGIATADVFDDVRTLGLWSVDANTPRITQVIIYADDAYGATGINGIETAYETIPGGGSQFVFHGERSGRQYPVIASRSQTIIGIFATVTVDSNGGALFRALSFLLSDGSKQDSAQVYALGSVTGFHGSLDDKGIAYH
ncbi:hypothetical protein H0H92_015623 [Tricholoma furcatifolium]|nr:hypothetical protein H0H92_015623 [Tricholoma furcatifolium]